LVVADMYERSLAVQLGSVDSRVTDLVLRARIGPTAAVPQVVLDSMGQHDDFTLSQVSHGVIIRDPHPWSAGGAGPSVYPMASLDDDKRAAPNPQSAIEPHCCLIKFEYPKNFSSVFKPGNPATCGFYFEGEAEFEENKDKGCRCNCCVFEQRISFQVNLTAAKGENNPPRRQVPGDDDEYNAGKTEEDCAYWTPGDPPKILGHVKDREVRAQASDNDRKYCYGDRNGFLGPTRDRRFEDIPGFEWGYYPRKKTKGDKQKKGNQKSNATDAGGDCFFYMDDSPSFDLESGYSGNATYNMVGRILDRCKAMKEKERHEFSVTVTASNVDGDGKSDAKASPTTVTSDRAAAGGDAPK
jgi:hypothetical protein